MKNRIKELREQKRISQVCLATHIGCSQNTISKMELEMSEPKASQLLEMAKYFNVSVDYILCNSDYKYIDKVFRADKISFKKEMRKKKRGHTDVTEKP